MARIEPLLVLGRLHLCSPPIPRCACVPLPSSVPSVLSPSPVPALSLPQGCGSGQFVSVVSPLALMATPVATPLSTPVATRAPSQPSLLQLLRGLLRVPWWAQKPRVEELGAAEGCSSPGAPPNWEHWEDARRKNRSAAWAPCCPSPLQLLREAPGEGPSAPRPWKKKSEAGEPRAKLTLALPWQRLWPPGGVLELLPSLPMALPS